MNKSCGQATPARLQEQSLPTQTKCIKGFSNPRGRACPTGLGGFRSCSCGFNRQAKSFVSQPGQTHRLFRYNPGF